MTRMDRGRQGKRWNRLAGAVAIERKECGGKAGLKPDLYEYLRVARLGFARLGQRILGGRILRMAALPARWQARHMYQLATVR